MGDFMKKVLIAAVAVLFAAASVFGVVTFKNKVLDKNRLKINEKSSVSEIVAFYNNSVKNCKNYKDFGLDVKTSVKLDEINSESMILNEMLSSIMGYKVGDSREETRSFSFKNGVDAKDSEKTPLSVIQPANAYVENFNASSLALKSVLCDDESASLSFEIKNESADLDSVLAAINPIIKGQTVSDHSQIAALAPDHSKFIDVGDIMSTVVDMLGISNMVNGSDNQNKDSVSNSGSKSVSIVDGKCIIGSTEISAVADSNEVLHSVAISVPVELKAGFKLVNNIIETSIQITVVQTYYFNYS